VDADEHFHLEGDGRGGATLHGHFAAARAAGWRLVRYVNHELLLPWEPGTPPRFKLNPRLAAARLGPSGWRALVSALEMAQTDPRPYFAGYHNGKSAVAVACGLAAAGVHGWYLAGERASAAPRLVEAGGPDGNCWLAGPSILHLHRPTPAAFREKYRAIAAAASTCPRPFAPSPLEEAAVALLRSLDGAEPAHVERQLETLYRRLTAFTEIEAELLNEAGLIFAPSRSRSAWR